MGIAKDEEVKVSGTTRALEERNLSDGVRLKTFKSHPTYTPRTEEDG